MYNKHYLLKEKAIAMSSIIKALPPLPPEFSYRIHETLSSPGSDKIPQLFRWLLYQLSSAFCSERRNELVAQPRNIVVYTEVLEDGLGWLLDQTNDESYEHLFRHIT